MIWTGGLVPKGTGEGKDLRKELESIFSMSEFRR